MAFKSMVGAICACLVVASFNVNAAMLVIDQAQTATGYGFFVTSPATYPSLTPRWQEFRPQYNNIEKIDLYITDQHRVDSTLKVWITDDTDSILWTANFSDAVLPNSGWLEIDTPRISVVPGMQYRVNLTVDKYPNDGNISASVFWLGSTTPTDYFVNDTTSGWPTYSYAFRTYSVVPVPAAAWLFGSGLLGLIGLARRKANA